MSNVKPLKNLKSGRLGGSNVTKAKTLKTWNYRKLTAACQTKASKKKRIGIIGNTSTRGSNGAYASGNFASNKAISNKYFHQFFTHIPSVNQVDH